MAGASRQNNFGIIKFVAAFMVLAGHMAYILGSPLPLLFEKGVQEIGVKTFFLIGGYLITKSWIYDPKPVQYAIKRIFRIVPALLFYVVLAILISGFFLTTLSRNEYFSNIRTWLYFKNVIFCTEFYLPGVFEYNVYPNAVNGSLWSLPVEVLMYICVPIVLTVLQIRRDKENNIFPLFFTIAVCIAQLCHLAYFPEARLVIYQTDWMQGMNLIPYYFIGMCYALYQKKIKLNVQLAVPIILVRACFYPHPLVNEVFMFLCYSYIIFSLALCEEPLFAKIMKNIEFSYGIFLWGFFVQQIVSMEISKHSWTFRPSFVLIFCLIICVILAWISREVIEKPALNLSKKIISLMEG